MYLNSSNPFTPPLKVNSMLSLNNNSAQASHGKPYYFHPNKLSTQHGSLKDLTLWSTVKSTLDVFLIAGSGSLLGFWTISQHPSGPVPRVSLPTSWGSRGWDPRGPVLKCWDWGPRGWALRIRVPRGWVARCWAPRGPVLKGWAPTILFAIDTHCRTRGSTLGGCDDGRLIINAETDIWTLLIVDGATATFARQISLQISQIGLRQKISSREPHCAPKTVN